MVTFRNNNNNRRNNFRRNERSFKTNCERQKFSSNFSTSENFKRKVPGRNNHNAPKLIEKYNDLAREALSNGDKILSENYLQHADHFTRILNEREIIRKGKIFNNKTSQDSKNSEQSENANNISATTDESLSENLNKEDKIDKNSDTETQIEIS